MNKHKLLLLVVVIWGSVPVHAAEAPKPPRKMNVLFIISDDLTATALSCYGNKVCKTPNIDRLAARGMLFTRAYCQGAYCGPSRASMMSGYYPHATGVQGYVSPRPAIGDRATWAQLFKMLGYYTARVGKIFHMGVPGGIEAGTDGADDPASWTERFNSKGPEWKAPGKGETLEGNPDGKKAVMGGNTFVVVAADGDDLVHADGKTAAKACELIELHKNEPFFLAVGFVRPHVPFVSPASYHKTYPWESMVLPEKVPGDWDDIPKAGINYKTNVNMKMNLTQQKKALAGYYAAVSFMDAQVGKILDALQRAGLADNTIIIFTSDHGFHLGEHEFWAKVSLHEESAKVPLIISVPGKKSGVSHSFVELLDLYPTTAKLCGLEVPARLQGKDLSPILENPAHQVRDTAFCVSGGSKAMLLRDERWAYIQYGEDAAGGMELYDMRKDPKQYTNLAKVLEFAPVVADFKAKMTAKLAAVRTNDLPGRPEGKPKKTCASACSEYRSCSMKSVKLFLICAMFFTGAASFSRAAGPNVLFIAADDMRPQLGCYGDRTVKSPHLDALAKRGMVFERSYVQQALCSPSRISMLSGRYPATTGIFEIGRTLRDTMPDITTLPQYFKNRGYHTRSLGKIYHVGIDDDASWTVPAWHSKKPRFGPIGRAAVESQRKDDEARGIKRQGRAKGVGSYASPAFEIVDGGDDDLLDGDTTVAAIAQLREHAKDTSRPFFLAVGFANPHVPWVAPKKYWDRYDRAQLLLATNEFLPKGAPKFATTAAQDFLSYANVPEGQLPEAFKRACLHGYLASISYVDAQVGRLLAALDEMGLAENTIVVFWSDHGYYMGEHTWWGMKHNNYEGATRNCLVIAQPGMKHAGTKTTALAQSVDLAPTLTELCGLPAHAGFQGRSLRPVLDNPAAVVNDATFSWYPKEGWLGVAMRTDGWRFIEWTKSGQQPVRELYDMTRDPQNDLNIADRPEYAKLRDSLSKRLRQRFPVQEFKQPPALKKRVWER